SGPCRELLTLVPDRDLKLEHVPITPAFLAQLPPELDWIQKEYAPAGPATITHTFRRGEGRPRTRHWTISAEGMSAVCSYFPYPVDQVYGTVEVETANA